MPSLRLTHTESNSMPFEPVPCTPDSIARAQRLADQERAESRRVYAAMERARHAGVPAALTDLFQVDGVEAVAAWLRVCVVELGRGQS